MAAIKVPEDLLEQIMTSVRAFVLKSLPYDQNYDTVFAHLNGMDVTNLLITYFNWTWRMVTTHPRHVHLSQEFVANPLRQDYSSELIKLLADIENGAELKKYLSRNIVHVAETLTNNQYKNTRRRRKDIDVMLNAWGIYHLHMGDVVEFDGFVKRSKHLLFVIFRRGHAFILDIMPHSHAWAREHIIRIVVKNWPQANLVYKINGVSGLSKKEIDDDSRLNLMQNHINTAVEIEGAVYMPSGGVTSAGFAVGAVRNADHVILSIEQFVARINEDSSFLIEQMNCQNISPPDKLQLEHVRFNPGHILLP